MAFEYERRSIEFLRPPFVHRCGSRGGGQPGFHLNSFTPRIGEVCGLGNAADLEGFHCFEFRVPADFDNKPPYAPGRKMR